PQILSEAELARIAGELAEGKPPMVWFTAAAVGVAEGKSGKVVALGDPADGDFLQVRPTGSKDVLSFGPSEVTLTKPARGTAAAPSNRKETTVTQPSTPPSAAPTPPRSLASVPAEPAAKPAPAPAPAP